jgi:hypothetical protein
MSPELGGAAVGGGGWGLRRRIWGRLLGRRRAREWVCLNLVSRRETLLKVHVRHREIQRVGVHYGGVDILVLRCNATLAHQK